MFSTLGSWRPIRWWMRISASWARALRVSRLRVNSMAGATMSCSWKAAGSRWRPACRPWAGGRDSAAQSSRNQETLRTRRQFGGNANWWGVRTERSANGIRLDGSLTSTSNVATGSNTVAGPSELPTSPRTTNGRSGCFASSPARTRPRIGKMSSAARLPIPGDDIETAVSSSEAATRSASTIGVSSSNPATFGSTITPRRWRSRPRRPAAGDGGPRGKSSRPSFPRPCEVRGSGRRRNDLRPVVAPVHRDAAGGSREPARSRRSLLHGPPDRVGRATSFPGRGSSSRR